MFINILTEIAPSEKFLVLGSCQVLVAAKSFLKIVSLLLATNAVSCFPLK